MDYCTSCNKKLNLFALQCKCGHKFCNKHLAAESHNCTYDYYGQNKKKLESIMLISDFEHEHRIQKIK